MYVNARAIIERPTADGVQILLQTRAKPGEPPQLELPGGQVEPYESLLDALCREVGEETGLGSWCSTGPTARRRLTPPSWRLSRSRGVTPA